MLIDLLHKNSNDHQSDGDRAKYDNRYTKQSFATHGISLLVPVEGGSARRLSVADGGPGQRGDN
jgi:hypothetical protein